MLDEFKVRLLEGDSPAYIADDLTKKVEMERLNRVKEIEQSKFEAKFLLWGLKQPKDSIPYAVADAFVKQFSQETGVEMAQPFAERIAALFKGKGEDSNE